MENNEKRPRRPRIGASRPAGSESMREDYPERYEKINYNQPNYPPRPYQPRYNDRSFNNGGNGYQPRSNSYSPEERHYQQRSNGYVPRGTQSHRSENDYQQHRQSSYQGGYNRRPASGYNNQGDRYDNRGPRHQGYSRGPRQQNGGRPYGGPRGQQPMRPQRNFVPTPRPIQYEMPLPDPNEQIRLNKFMANSGICSRREADEFIKQGLVKVNGQVVTELGTKISHNDTVEYDEKVVALENKSYILLNKPKDCVTTSDDPHGRMTVMDLVKGACRERIYPVGRLDRNTTGVLLLTNDGDLASKLTHPKYDKKKIYHVWTDKDITEEDMQKIADGIELDDGEIHADAISYANETDKNQAGVEIHSGRNRIVRRMFEKLGYHVTKLDRVYFAGLTKKNLPRGRWRYLTQQEVNMLKRGSFV